MSSRFDAIADAVIKAAYRIIARFFRTKAILKLLAIIIAVIALNRFVGWIPTLQVKRAAMPQRICPVPVPSQEVIAKNTGRIIAAANGGKTMYADPANGNISVVDDESGIVWNSFRQEADEIPENISLLRIAFLSEDNKSLNWYSYEYCQKDGNFTFETIPNGVRLIIQIGNFEDPVDINVFMPRRISVDRYEKIFLKGLEDLAGQGVITKADADKYKNVLDLIYLIDESGEFYFNKLRFLPPISATRQMLAMVRLLGYTTEQLVEDEAPYDLPVIDRRPPVGFIIPVDYILDEGDLVVSISTENIEVLTDFYTLTRLYLMPNFGSVSAKESPGGFIFVPDGSGALFALNSFNPNYNGYERPLYWNSVFRDYINMPQFPEDLWMPVYGMMYQEGGFFAIIEKGDETAFIGTRIASPKPGSSGDMYNSVFPVFDVTQYRQISIVGGTGNFGTYAAGTGMLDMDIVVRYKLFGKPITYFDMAAVYKNHLIKKYDFRPDYIISPEIFLDVTGALTIEGRFLGKKYNRTISMTRYPELAEILEDLRGIPVTVSYNGVFNGGIDNKLSNRAVLVSKNGTSSELDCLMELADDTGTDIYMGINLDRIYKRTGNGYSSRTHAAYGYNGYPLYFWGYDLPTRSIGSFSTPYNLLNPLYLPDVLDGFMADAKNYDKISINDLGTDYLASYKRNAVVPPLAARAIVNESLKRLEREKTLALNNPSVNNIPYAAWALNISRESSDYGGFFTSIPFRQLVMNGLIRYTTLDVNNSGESMDYYLLQALELGSVPKFTITAQNADALKYTTHTSFLSTQYETHKNNIEEMYRRWEEAFDKIKSWEIINHETLADKVYRTTYRNGISVTVNYRRYAAETDDGIIAPLGYIIKETGQ